MVIIHIKNNKCNLSGDIKHTNLLYNKMKLRHPQAFYVRAYMPKGWDGKMDYIKDTGNFDTGLIYRVIELCQKEGIKYKLVDDRLKHFKFKRKNFDDSPYRDYQLQSIKAITENEIDGVRLPVGTIKVATNGGKTYICAGIHNYYRSKTIMVINSKELYEDALRDIPKLIDSSVGYIGDGKIVWGDFMICMVGTLRNKLPVVAHRLHEYKVKIWDECDMANNKTNKKVAQALYATLVSVGLSGTINVSKLKKDMVKNLNLEGMFGPQVYEISNRDLIDRGISSEVAVKFVWGNKDLSTTGSWQEDMEEFIVKNKQRNRKVLKRSIKHWEKGRRSQLIIAQRKKHVEKLYRMFTKHYGPDVKIEWAHSGRNKKDRIRVSTDFMDGKIDILIGSMIYKRGKNFKKMNYMLNAGGGKSLENLKQLLGRAFRGAKHFEDFLDKGKYLGAHSKKRYLNYKEEKIKVTLPKSVKSIHSYNRKPKTIN